mmetsp:Transcript_73922/g.158434  ORF Transcript_73922/g.158434 Transcript_73922/m.158434 type:complete len:136 (+) Transcript_73922:137-544(+)
MSSARRSVALALLLAAWGPAVPIAAGAGSCNPASQVCDYSELQEEMSRAASRGSAFIQERRSRSTSGGKQRRGASLQEHVAAYDTTVQQQVTAALAKGARKVSHQRRAVVAFKNGAKVAMTAASSVEVSEAGTSA